MTELLRSGIMAGGFTLLLCGIFVVVYWMWRGFPPGSRLIELDLPKPNALDGTTAQFKLFYVKWCPYSSDAKEKMKELQNIVKGYTYGGKRVQIEFTDCEVHKDDCHAYNVEAYPTYKLETSLKMYEYLGPASTRAYRTFLADALGKEVAAN